MRTYDRVYIFGSTSKITFAGGGLGFVAMSQSNSNRYLGALSSQTIGPDKLNQLRHVLFLQNMENIRSHMAKHRQILASKFKAASDALASRLGGKGIASWSDPAGGYFICLRVLPRCAKRVIQLAHEAGVKLTATGATFPYGEDPEDSIIRIAPSFPSLTEIETAMEVVALCIEIAVAEKHH